MPQSSSHGASFASRGVLASVGASVFFAGIYFVTPMLTPLPSEPLWALRNIVTLPFVALVLVVIRQWSLVVDVIAKVRRRPLLALGVAVCGFLVAVQLWLFGWAPLHGRGLQVALGYFLLPLVLVVIGRFLYKDKMTWWQWAACGIAAVGVGFEAIRVGGVSWETLLVALGYPVYFVLRRSMGTGHLGGMFWEFAAMAPVAVVFLTIELTSGSSLQQNPSLYWLGPAFGLLSAVALLLYLGASWLLPMALFGLLSYVEPALLIVASVLNGERIGHDEWFTYGAIWCAVLVLIAGGAVQIARSRRGPAV
ncbi:EamA family transporter RarD [Leucobacter sp. CSA1]|uniref:EamA family transporter RarD n=1 Tax=Leucobacter chromiisoli TaxID=2796471 RepID=A0A934Q8M2_9MICO|nr:EamA family transporter RarD [Leucobacter chromiisoli]MBK0419488.1 EamA family transporter RarD [Leucobacter chromiisoli]